MTWSNNFGLQSVRMGLKHSWNAGERFQLLGQQLKYFCISTNLLKCLFKNLPCKKGLIFDDKHRVKLDAIPFLLLKAMRKNWGIICLRESYILRKHEPILFFMSQSPEQAVTYSKAFEECILLNRTAWYILFHLKKVLNCFIELDYISS